MISYCRYFLTGIVCLGQLTLFAFRAGAGSPIYVDDVTTDPAKPTVIYVATSEGLLRSPDDGASWVRLTNGLPKHAGVLSIVATPDGAGALLAVTTEKEGEEHIYRSTDGGDQWQKYEKGMPQSAGPFWGIRTASVPTPSVYAIEFNPMVVSRIYRLDKKEWTVLWELWDSSQSQVSAFFPTFEIDPKNSQRIHSVGYMRDAEDPGPALVESRDGGRTWARISDIPIGAPFHVALTADVLNPSRIYLSTRSNGGIGLDPSWYLSTTAGRTWRQLSALEHRKVQQFYQMPLRRNVFFGVTGDYVTYRSADGGRSWQTLKNDPHGWWYVGSRVDQDVVFTNPLGTTLFRSRDRGLTWERIQLPDRVAAP